MATPIVTSITVDQPSTTTAHILNFTVTFSEAVTNVNQADFFLSYLGGMTGVAITNVASVSGEALDTSWLVTVNAGPDPGFVQIGLVGNDVYDLDGNTVVPPWRVMNFASITTSDDGRAPDDITGPFYIAAGDINLDGFVDLVTSNPNDNRVAVLFGDGSGAFTQSDIYSVDGAPFGQGEAYAIGVGTGPYGVPADLTLADLDSDGDLDMAVAVLEHFNGTDTDSHSGVAILWNDFGTFAGSTSDLSGNPLPFDYYEGVGEGPRRVVAGDLDGDGYNDLVVANSYDGTVSVMVNNTDKNFIGSAGTFPTYAVGTGIGDAFDIKLGDVDNDGDLDIIGVNAASRNAFVLPGDGLGGFGSPISTPALTTTGSPRGLDVGDIDGDGNLDAVIVNDIDNNVQILLGNGDGTFAVGDTYGVGDRPFSITLTDINGDERLDILTTNRFDNTITILHGQGDGNFVLHGDALGSNPTLPDAGAYPTDLIVVDANGDLVPDIVATGYHSTNVYTLPGADGIYLSPVVDIVSGNAPPVAVADSATTDEDTAVTITVLANDSDAEDGSPLPGTVTAAFGATHGTVSINADGTIAYTPSADYSGADSFTYEVTDSLGDTATASVDVTINPVNDAPALSTSSTTLSYIENGPALVIAPALTITDVDSATLLGAIVTIASGFVVGEDALFVTPQGGISASFDAGTGELTLLGEASLADYQATLRSVAYFNSSENPSGAVRSIAFQVDDGEALHNLSNVHTIDVDVEPVNDAPFIGENEQFIGSEDFSVVADIGWFDPDSSVVTFSLVTGPAHGDLILLTDGHFQYTPDADFFGTDSFTFTADDGDGGIITRTAHFNIAAVNDAPDAADHQQFSGNEDTTITGAIAASDVDSPTLTFAAVTGPLHGTLALASNGTFTYTPAADYNGTDSFTYTVDDGAGGLITRTAELTIAPVNDAPVVIESLESIALAENLVNAAAQAVSQFGSGVSDPRVVDVDSTDFAGGQVAFRLAYFDVNDGVSTHYAIMPAGWPERPQNVLSLLSGSPGAPDIAVSGTSVAYQGTEIGTISATENGQGGRDLVVDLNANATAAAVTQLMRALAYQNTSDTPIGNRLITVQVSDGDGGTSTLDTNFVPANSTGVWVLNVTPENDAAVIGGVVARAITEDASPNTVSGQLTITDVDSSATFQAVATEISSANGYGTFTVTSGGLWTYTLDNGNPAVNALNTTESLADSFTVEAADGTSQTISITINGNTDGIVGNVVNGTNGNNSGWFGSLYGTSARDIINALDGNDTAYGFGGNDDLFGGNGNDTLYGDYPGNIFGTFLGFLFPGVDGNDLLDGGAGNDTLLGGGGNDRLIGGSERDFMTGGAGADVFVFDDGDSGPAPGERDRIMDFNALQGDTIDLRLVDGNTATPEDDGLVFAITQQAALAAAGSIFISAYSGGQQTVFVNTSETAGFELTFVVSSNSALLTSDILV